MHSARVAFLLIASVGLHGPAWVQYSVPHDPANTASSTANSDASEFGLLLTVDQPAILKSAFAEMLMVPTEVSIDGLPAHRLATARPPAVRLTLQSQHVLLRI